MDRRSPKTKAAHIAAMGEALGIVSRGLIGTAQPQGMPEPVGTYRVTTDDHPADLTCDRCGRRAMHNEHFTAGSACPKCQPGQYGRPGGIAETRCSLLEFELAGDVRCSGTAAGDVTVVHGRSQIDQAHHVFVEVDGRRSSTVVLVANAGQVAWGFTLVSLIAEAVGVFPTQAEP